MRETAAAQRGFIVRAVRALARKGVWRFLVIGGGYPEVHEAARMTSPGCRVAYAGTVTYAVPDSRVASVAVDIQDPQATTGNRQIRELFGTEDRKVAVILTGVLDHITDLGQARKYVAMITEWLPAWDNYLVATHVTSDGTASDVMTAASQEDAALVFRSQAEIADLFHGLILLRPGIAEVSQWRVTGRARSQPPLLRCVGAVARKGSPET